MGEGKLAVLILVHKNVKQVRKLIRSLKNPNIDIFIHCDSRWEEGYLSLLEEKLEDVYLVSERVESDLDTWRLVEGTMNLIEAALRTGNKYKYYILLSGQDYPLISAENIINKLKSVYPKPFIDCTPYDHSNWIYYKFFDNNTFRIFSRYLNEKIKIKILRKFLKLPVYVFDVIKNIYFNKKRKLDKLGIKLYGGSAWWILPDMIIEYIYDEYKSDKEYVKILSETWTPEETFFQIVTMNSPFSDLVEVNPINMVHQNCKTYAYFFDDEKKFKGHPYIFKINDARKLLELSKTHFFARKFDINVDEEVFSWIEKFCWNNEENTK